MKLNFLTQMREAAQQLLSKGIPLQRAAERPAMRDINPPPAAPPVPPPRRPAPRQAPNPATHPAEYAQDILNRMGIKLDMQANLEHAIDLGSLLHPAPAPPPKARNSSAAAIPTTPARATTSCTSRPATTARPCRCW
jgi:hypothetical protein